MSQASTSRILRPPGSGGQVLVVGGSREIMRRASSLQAAAWGVYLHARAGEVLARKLGPLGCVARELLTEIPPLLAQLTRR